MKKNSYQILKKNIPQVKLVSLTGQTWYDYDDQLVNWSGSVYVGPNQNDVVYNVTGSLSSGYYKWTGTTWNSISDSSAFDDHNLPIYIESTVDEMGVMVGFDGNIQQVEELVNFSYSGTVGTTGVTIYSTTNSSLLRKIIEQEFTIFWGDGTSSTLSVNQGIENENLPSVSHTYLSPGQYEIVISLESPWTSQKLKKIITVPFDDFTSITGDVGTYTTQILSGHGYSYMTGQTIDYLNDLDYTNTTGVTTGFTYLSIGKSKLSEKLKYGQNPNLITSYSGVTTGSFIIDTNFTGTTFETLNYTGYSIDNLYYRDYEGGYTQITGTTSGVTKEEVVNYVITRNEHFLGFIDEPVIYSDVFVERGKQSVMEKNLRLNEIDNLGELRIYGNGYFNVRKQ